MTAVVSRDIPKLIEHFVLAGIQQEYTAEPRVLIGIENEIKFERFILSPLIDACPRDHKGIYPRDASVSHAIDEMLTDQDDHADSKISGIHGDLIGET